MTTIGLHRIQFLIPTDGELQGFIRIDLGIHKRSRVRMKEYLYSFKFNYVRLQIHFGASF
jgi:hypothetical protein